MRYSIRNEYKVLAGEKLVPYKTLQNTPFEKKVLSIGMCTSYGFERKRIRKLVPVNLISSIQPTSVQVVNVSGPVLGY